MEDIKIIPAVDNEQNIEDEEQNRIEELDRLSIMDSVETEIANQQAIVDSLTEELECCET